MVLRLSSFLKTYAVLVFFVWVEIPTSSRLDGQSRFFSRGNPICGVPFFSCFFLGTRSRNPLPLLYVGRPAFRIPPFRTAFSGERGTYRGDSPRTPTNRRIVFLP